MAEEGEGKQEETPWVEKHPEDVRDLEIFKNSPDEDTFYKRLADQQQYVGQSIRIPSEDAGEDAWSEFEGRLQDKVPTLMRTPSPEKPEEYNRVLRSLGAPEKEEEYSRPELTVEDGMQVADDMIGMFQSAAHKHNLTQKQFEGVLTEVHNAGIENTRIEIEARRADRESLKKEWGSALDDRLNAITVFMAKTGAPEGLLKIADTGDSATLKWLHAAVKAIPLNKADGAGGRTPGKEAPITPNEAKIKISEIRGNRKHPYNNPNDPGHKAAKSAVRQLYIYADPERATQPAGRGTS